MKARGKREAQRNASPLGTKNSLNRALKVRNIDVNYSALSELHGHCALTGENIFVHEFSHAIMGIGIRTVDSSFFAEIQAAYKQAMEKGLWKNHYASTNANEYWAEGTQTWFWSNYEYVDGDIHVQSPDDLQRYDPKLYELLSRVYPDHHIPLDVYYGKNIAPPRRRP